MEKEIELLDQTYDILIALLRQYQSNQHVAITACLDNIIEIKKELETYPARSETIREECCPCCGFYKTLDGLWHAPEKFTPKQLAKRIQKTGEKVCLKQGDP